MGEDQMPSEGYHPKEPKSSTEVANLLFPYFLIIAIGVLCYSGAFDASFIFDDSHAIVKNEGIRDIWNLKDIWHINPCRFMAYFTFALNYKIHQLNLFGFHLTNLLIHLSAAMTLFWLLRLLFQTPELRENKLAPQATNFALAVSLIFVSHPIETQAVTYIVQRIASMACLFYLLSLVLYVKSRLLYDQKKHYFLILYTGSILASLMAMFTKEIAITLPISFIMVEYFFFSPSIGRIAARLKLLFPLLLTIPVVPLTHLLTRETMVTRFGVAAETDTIGRFDYLLTQFNVVRTYLGLLFFPLGQSLDYDFPVSKNLFEPITFASFLLIISLIVFALASFRRYRLLSFGIVWFFLTLSVESSLIPIRDVIYEHRLYLPSIGIFLSVSVLLFHLLGHKKKMLFALLVLIISLASFATVTRNIVWKENVLVWNEAVQKAPNKFRVYINRGVAYSNLKKKDLAIRDFNLAIALNKNHPYPYLNRGTLYLSDGNYESALKDFNMALKLDPDMAKGYIRRGFAYVLSGRPELGYKDYLRAVRLEPNNPFFLNALGTACDELGRYDLALHAFNKAIALDNTKATPHLNRGKTYRSMGKFSTAIEDFDRAESLAQEVPEIYYHRGVAFVGLHQYKRAVADFTRAITRNPGYVKAYGNRAMAYHRLGLNERALVDLNKAIALDPSLPKLYLNRASVFRALGREEEAGNDRNKAVKLERE